MSISPLPNILLRHPDYQIAPSSRLLLIRSPSFTVNHVHQNERGATSCTTLGTCSTYDRATYVYILRSAFFSHLDISQVEYADLPIVDLSLPREAFLEQVHKVKHAMETHGFLYCVNHPHSVEEVSQKSLLNRLGMIRKENAWQMTRVFSIANVPFRVSDEEEKIYEGKMKTTGCYQGYKLREYWVTLPLTTQIFTDTVILFRLTARRQRCQRSSGDL